MRDSDELTITGLILAGLSLIVAIAGFAQPEIRRCVGLDQGDCSFGNSGSLPKTVSPTPAIVRSPTPTESQKPSLDIDEVKLHVRFPGMWAGFADTTSIQVFLDGKQVGTASCYQEFNLDIDTNVGRHKLMFQLTSWLGKRTTDVYDLEIPRSGQYEVLLTPADWGVSGCFNDNFSLTQQ
jgi:hypothetical protein